MFLSLRILFMFTEAPLHAGTGSTLGIVDLPIQRERSTGYPQIYASSLKGALRSQAKGTDDEIAAIFGPSLDIARAEAEEEGPGASAVALHAGAVSPGDARLLLFPVRSLDGVYAWVTSLDVLHRFRRDATYAGLTDVPELPSAEPGRNQAYVPPGNTIGGDEIVLEEFAFSRTDDAAESNKVACLAKWLACQALPDDALYKHGKDKLKTSLVILPQEAFRDFVRWSTEVVTRIKLVDETKTVQGGALWTEEFLPVDSLLYAPVHATPLRIPEAAWASLPTQWQQRKGHTREKAQEQAEAALDWLACDKNPEGERNLPERIQIGGDETVGRGIVRLRWNGGTT